MKATPARRRLLLALLLMPRTDQAADASAFELRHELFRKQ